MVKLIVQVVSLKEARHIFLTNNIKADKPLHKDPNT